MTKKDSVLVIGAGAAGLGAARVLQQVGWDVQILEARARIGGRIWTTEVGGVAVEAGAEFIHGPGAVTHDLLKAAGLIAEPIQRGEHLWWAEPGEAARRDLAPELKQEFQNLWAIYEQLGQSVLDRDGSFADYFKTRGWAEKALERAEVLLAQPCCAPLDALSCQDHIQEMQVDRAGSGDFRIVQGYRALLKWLSQDLTIHLNTCVHRIQWGSEGVQVWAGEQSFAAQACILTVPVSILKAERISFDPPLSPTRTTAVRSFHTEAATKLIYSFSTPVWPEDLVYLAHLGLTARWWSVPRQPILVCFVTAERARRLDALSEAQACAQGLQDLSTLLDVSLSQLQSCCTGCLRVSWARDPYALGGYAHLPPHTAHSRKILAQPEAGVLFFAGEATAFDSNPQTVHGAIESGYRAARECLAIH
ncbi:MAG: FAD-dependent oxidoreductase [Synechococcaceae cyanobacterium SM2_3_1]|nr:FAD-dependent oxidoreductase [Synechococcaceae cyanobacterium SM2_3_1]